MIFPRMPPSTGLLCKLSARGTNVLINFEHEGGFQEFLSAISKLRIHTEIKDEKKKVLCDKRKPQKTRKRCGANLGGGFCLFGDMESTFFDNQSWG